MSHAIELLCFCLAAFIPILAVGVGAPLCRVNATIGDATPHLALSEVQSILDAHNNARQAVSGAKSMVLLRWNRQPSTAAQEKLTQCVVATLSPTARQGIAGYSVVGQNVVGYDDTRFVTAATDAWLSGQRYFNYTSSCAPGASSCGCTGANNTCASYTQVIWAATTDVGCGKIDCPGHLAILSCFYGPAGNVVGQTPYEAGAPPQGCQYPKEGEATGWTLWKILSIIGGVAFALAAGVTYMGHGDGACCDDEPKDKTRRAIHAADDEQVKEAYRRLQADGAVV